MVKEERENKRKQRLEQVNLERQKQAEEIDKKLSLKNERMMS